MATVFRDLNAGRELCNIVAERRLSIAKTASSHVIGRGLPH
jgi:hypothetical protein